MYGTDSSAVVVMPAEDPLLPPSGNGLSASRRWVGLAIVVAGLPALTAILVLARDSLSLGTDLLLYLLAVVAVAVVGGTVPAVVAAVSSFLLANWFLTPPYHTFDVEQRDSVISLVVFVVAGLVVSVTVESAARQRVRAGRTQVEVELLTRFAAQPVSDTTLAAVLRRVRDLFGMTSVALLEHRDAGWEVVDLVGPPMQGPPVISVDVHPDLRLVAAGPGGVHRSHAARGNGKN